MSTPRRLLLVGTVALLLVWIALASAVYPSLPEELATHFGPNGMADHFAAKSIGTWFMLPAVGASTTWLILGLAALIPSRPGLFNTPAKAELLALPDASRRPLLEEAATVMTALGLSIAVLFATIHWDTWRVAVTTQRGLSLITWIVMAISLGGSTIGLLIWSRRFHGRILAARDAVAAQELSATARRAS